MSDNQPKRAWIIFPDDSIEEVSLYQADQEELCWSRPHLQTQRPGEPTRDIGPENLFTRHHLEDDVYVFVCSDQDLDDVPETVLNRVRDLAKQ